MLLSGPVRFHSGKIALHSAEQSSIPSISYGPPSMPEIFLWEGPTVVNPSPNASGCVSKIKIRISIV